MGKRNEEFSNKRRPKSREAFQSPRSQISHGVKRDKEIFLLSSHGTLGAGKGLLVLVEPPRKWMKNRGSALDAVQELGIEAEEKGPTRQELNHQGGGGLF